MRVAKEGLLFVLPILILAAAAFGFGWIWIGGPLFIFALKLAFFFRDPIRYTPQNDNLIFSPADGTIIKIQDLGGDASSIDPLGHRSPAQGSQDFGDGRGPGR